MRKNNRKPMTNVKMSTKGNKLVITVDLDKHINMSYTSADLTGDGTTGNYRLASSHGNQQLEGENLEGLTLGLNLYANSSYVQAKQQLIADQKMAQNELASAKSNPLLDKLAKMDAQKLELILQLVDKMA